VKRWVALIFILGCTNKTAVDAGVKPPETAPPKALFMSLGEDGLPSGPETHLILTTRCQICHVADYVKQQRLTPAQWEATVQKMVTWGAPLSPAETASLAAVLAEAYPPDRPDFLPTLRPAPEGAVHISK